MVAIRRNFQNVSLGDAVRTLSDVKRFGRTVNRIMNQPPEGFNIDGTYIFDEDWDNLVLLDSCRYDFFADAVEFDGTLESKISRGSGTPEFIRGNFQGPDQLDTVYVSANGWYTKISEELGDERSDVFLFDHVDASTPKRELGHLREQCELVTERALRHYHKHPDKRFIIHYMPPHRPYVDENGDIIVDFENEHTMDTFYNLIYRSSGKPGRVTKAEITAAYESSVTYILDHIERLLTEIEGRTVVSADHGELLAERSRPVPIIEKSHPRGVYVDQLIKVPWFIMEDDFRRDIVEADRPHESIRESKEVSEDIDEHLRSLGYKV